MDVHVPRSLTEALLARKVEVMTAQEDEHDRAADSAVLARATALNRVLFTRDEDFLAICAQWQQLGRPFAGVIYAHQLRVTIGRCVQDLATVAKVGEPDDLANRLEHLPL